MKLSEYTKNIETAASLSRRLSLNPALITQWKVGSRDCPSKRCIQIERATGGQVMRWDLRPDDWWQIWPELVDHPDSPPIPTTAVSSIPDGLFPGPQGLGSFSAGVQHE